MLDLIGFFNVILLMDGFFVNVKEDFIFFLLLRKKIFEGVVLKKNKGGFYIFFCCEGRGLYFVCIVLFICYVEFFDKYCKLLGI